MEVYFQQNNELQKNDGSQWRRLTATPRLDDDNAPDGDASEQHVSEHAAYYHGDENVASTIVGIAQFF
uniref:Uncharacterized protein n=1 Tax=Physcomitrium patens TaxID=3218 RepID=A0A2K1IMH1_PHYPA|nr:hypothetical protein PHYPA_026787 [Physcomitrium patens]